MIIFLFVCIIFLIACVFHLKKQLSNKITIDNETLKKNEKIALDCNVLQEQKTGLQKDVEVLQNLISEKDNQNQQLQKQIDLNRQSLEHTIDQNKEISEKAFEQYASSLEFQYQQVETSFDEKIAKLRETEQNEIADLQNQKNDIKTELQKLKDTRAAAHQALLKEQEIKDDKDNYRLKPSESDLADARRLEVVKRELNKPRILAMLVWQTYWQPLAKKQFPLILKDKTKCGIYKITNLITDQCYIGQAVDVYTRWNQHCKCGLGIDTPPGNKLYQAMQEYGLENFTFELVEECSQSELNEKEHYFIELYQADLFGYNGNKGVTK